MIILHPVTIAVWFATTFEVKVKGEPNIKLRFEKGVFGDSATVTLVVHALERVGNAMPGLLTVLDLPLTSR